MYAMFRLDGEVWHWSAGLRKTAVTVLNFLRRPNHTHNFTCALCSTNAAETVAAEGDANVKDDVNDDGSGSEYEDDDSDDGGITMNKPAKCVEC
jgi:hypothetical protein